MTQTPNTIPETMHAVTARRYGGPKVLNMETIPTPHPGPGQLLVRVSAFGVTRGDSRIRALDVPVGFGPLMRLMFGLRRPRRAIPGREFAGVVAALGPGATGFAPGDAVFGITDGFQLGASAEYLTVSAAKLVFHRPPSLTPEQAAGFLFGGLTAMDFLFRQAGLRAGERILINGATGAVGGAMTQIARHHGAPITALCSAANAALATQLGANRVHDYHHGLPDGPFDVIADIAGTITVSQARERLAPGGRFCRVTCGLGGTLGGALRPNRGRFRICAGAVSERRDAVGQLLKLHAAGGYVPHLLPPYPFDATAQAHTRADSGHKPGNIVVRIDGVEAADNPP